MRGILCAIIFSLVTTVALAAEKVALLIGNSAYTEPGVSALPNPVNDVRAMSAVLTRHGFDVTPLENLTRAQMNDALGTFRKKVRQADIALVFYAGHGIEIGGKNYLIPTDAELYDEGAAPVEAISLDTVLHQIRDAKTLKMVVLDACRNNPFINRMLRRGASRSGGAGLGKVENLKYGTLVAYAAAAGETTPDGAPGGNSPYTRALIDALEGDVHDVGRLFRVAGANLRKSVPGAAPFLEMSLGGDEYIIQRQPSETVAIVTTPKPTPSAKTAEELYTEGLNHYLGWGVKQDHRRAAELYRKAADLGHTSAMNDLGVQYREGEGVPRDYGEAARLFRKAADLGDTQAMANLATLYDRGEGVPEDDGEAARLYRKAADLGDTDAMVYLALLYDKGEGVSKDPVEAARLLLRAIANGERVTLLDLSFGGGGVYKSTTRREIQRLLKADGVYSGPIDGDFGPATERAIQAYWDKHN